MIGLQKGKTHALAFLMAGAFFVSVGQKGSSMAYTTFTSESVASGHPDKICDQVSDAIVDAALAVDPYSRVAVETLVTKDRIVLAGEVTCPISLNYRKIARRVIKDLGYTNGIYSFSFHSPISVYIHEQSPDIARGVDDGGAGDQGMMFGYATDETPEYMPLPVVLSHRLVAAMDEARQSGTLPYLRPDGKSEVTVGYENGIPKKVERVVLAVPHDPSVTNATLRAELYEKIVLPILHDYHLAEIPLESLIVNGTGVWEIGGPASDTGVTGRKIIVDTYGGAARHGGGAFSGKDPTKVDRSGAYATRFLAKNIVASGLAKRCEARIAYVIGKKDPIAIGFETFGTGTKDEKYLADYAKNILDLSVKGILEGLSLRQPIYKETARYGHFGREQFPWERLVS